VTFNNSIAAIYDFELFPYALGDVLTWNVRTAMRCEDLGRKTVDIYICADEQFPAGIYQRGLVNPQNFELFFSELYSAFGTHPRLGNIYIFRQRESLLEKLREIVANDEINAEAVGDYLNVLEYRVSDKLLDKVWQTVLNGLHDNQLIRGIYNRWFPSSVKTAVGHAAHPDEKKINDYFIKYIHSHEAMNEFAARRGGIPLLQPALGCVPDVNEIIAQKFAGKKIVPFHLRLRRLDAGYGGAHSHDRDSDFLEWYDFLNESSRRYPEVAFIALGRLQEKPLELLRLPNVTSLRIFGMQLGHELTLMLKSNLFIGTSSGFAALANFSSIPYFITRMNSGSCRAYAIPDGAERLPFAQENQKLIYQEESSELLMDLLKKGLGLPERRADAHLVKTEPSESRKVDVPGWLGARSQPVNSAATTSRFFIDDKYRVEETGFLLLASLERARQALLRKLPQNAAAILKRVEENFPDLCEQLPEYQLLRKILSGKDVNSELTKACLAEYGDFSKPKVEIRGLTTTINTSPLFESSQGWGPGFAKATGRGPGVVVGPGRDHPSVFAQQFLTRPHAPYKIVACASSVGQARAKGRFQINWTNSENKFISASIEAFEVVSKEKIFDCYLTAPAGAAVGTLYVVPDGAEDVVRYTEMRLLGKS